jgi:hypothetical protein
LAPRKENKKRADRQKPTGAWKGSRAGEEGTRGGGRGERATKRRERAATPLYITRESSRVGKGKTPRNVESSHRQHDERLLRWKTLLR